VEQDVQAIDKNSVTLEENINILLPSANVQYVSEIEINTTAIKNVQRSIECNGKVWSPENFILEENKTTSLPSAADVQYVLKIEMNTTEIWKR
jgi:hypothetical protein